LPDNRKVAKRDSLVLLDRQSADPTPSKTISTTAQAWKHERRFDDTSHNLVDPTHENRIGLAFLVGQGIFSE
jgi:hypothetical protein